MRINRDEREGDIDFDFPSRDGETRDVSRTKMNMWMGQAASGAIQTNQVEWMRGLLRCMAMAYFVETNCDIL